MVRTTRYDHVEDDPSAICFQGPLVPHRALSDCLGVCLAVDGSAMVRADSMSGGIVAQGPNHVVLQVVLKEKFMGTGSGNLTELEAAIDQQAAKGYRLHTISTAASGSKGFGGGDRVQATMVFEAV